MALYISLGAIGLSMFTYSISRPGKDGEQSSLSKWIDSYRAGAQDTWEQRNTLRTNIKDQAAADRHTFNTQEKTGGYEVRMPEYVNGSSFFLYPRDTEFLLWWTGRCAIFEVRVLTDELRLINAGSPHNVPAGHYVNLDKVVEHYRKAHLDEEERKAKKFAEARQEK